MLGDNSDDDGDDVDMDVESEDEGNPPPIDPYTIIDDEFRL